MGWHLENEFEGDTLRGVAPEVKFWGWPMPHLATSLALPLFSIHLHHLLGRGYTPQCSQWSQWALSLSATVTVITFDFAESLAVISSSAWTCLADWTFSFENSPNCHTDWYIDLNQYINIHILIPANMPWRKNNGCIIVTNICFKWATGWWINHFPPKQETNPGKSIERNFIKEN